MRKSRLFSVVALGCLCALASVAQAQDAIRASRNMCRNWLFARCDVVGAESSDYQEGSEWYPIDLPHTWNLADTFDEEPSYYRGVGWYRQVFDVGEGTKGKRVVLRFEGACNVATVWVNGQLLGQHKGAWTPFEFDITAVVRPSNNLLAVKVDNRWRRDVPPHDMDFNIMGGLHREVYLITRDLLHIVSTRTTTPQVSDSEGVAVLETEVRNDDKETKNYQVVAAIRGPGLSEPITLTSPVAKLQPGETALVKQQTKPIRNVNLWSPDEPNLYQLSFRLVTDGRAVDDAKSPLGFRWYRFDANQGFFLNGKHLKLHGVNRHDDYPGLGWVLPHPQQVEDLKQLKRMGVNFIRTAHYPQHPVVYDTCDKLGIMVWEEVPFDGEGMHRALVVGAEDFARTLKQNLRDMIQRDRNHPAIILWSMGNENLNGPNLDDWKAVANLTKELVQITREEDPTRPTTVAIHKPERAAECGLAEAVDVVGYNIYAGWSHLYVEEAIDAARRLCPNKPIIISEYGLDIERGRHAETPQYRDFSEEWGCMYHETYWKAILARPYIAGGLVWVGCDFGSERRVILQTIPHLNQKGLIAFDRQPKDAYYLLQSLWTENPMAYIVSHTWTQRKQGNTPIRVYSNCDSVGLFHNGKSLGIKSKGETFLWSVPLSPGNNALRAEASRAGKTVVDIINIQGEL